MGNLLVITLAVNLFWLWNHADYNDSQLSQPLLNSNQKQVTEEAQKPFKGLPEELVQIKAMLKNKGTGLSPQVINKALTILQCTNRYDVDHNNILTIIDYSLPSNQKRLWVFDIAKKSLLFNTYVSHGIKSGALFSQFFSNKFNSKASSLGIYDTENSYYGRDGLSLKLIGLEKGFNDNAYNRFIVLHGGWYVEKQFINKYGRPGRSWGCPVIPLHLVKPLINTIKGKSLFIAYYPGENWLVKSKFLHCIASKQLLDNSMGIAKANIQENETRKNVLFIDKKNNDKRDDSDPMLVLSADDYQHLFNLKPPLKRMLRRQINNMEYIALSNAELEYVILNDKDKNYLNEINFVIPYLISKHGYWETQFKILNLGKIKDIVPKDETAENKILKSFVIHFENGHSKTLRTTKRFIRWLGL